MLESIAVSITDRCNLRCSHCGSYKGEKCSLSHELDRITLQKLFLELHQIGVGSVTISGGEPFLHKDIIYILDDMSKADLHCVLATNGTLLDNRILKQLKSLGIVDCIRLSVEYPENIISKNEGLSFHDAKNVFSVIELLVEYGITAGINMVLLPDNFFYAAELAYRSKKAGASFFRVVPLIPVGRSEKVKLTEHFLSDCIATALSVCAEFSDRSSNKYISESDCSNRDKCLVNDGEILCSSCMGGTRSIYVSADGKTHICGIYDFDIESPHINKHSLSECISILTEQRKYLQHKLINTSGCKECKLVSRCAGGCLSEWFAGRSDNNKKYHPCCYRKSWKGAIESNIEKKEIIYTAMELIDNYKRYLIFNQPVSCVRALPLWKINL